MNQDELLAARYGRTSKSRLRDRRLAIAIAGTALLSFLVWAVAVSIENANRVTAEATSFEVLSEQQTEVSLKVSRPRTDPVVCQVEVLDSAYTVVGYREVLFLSNTGDQQTIKVNTTSRGVTGVAKDCWFK